MIGASREPNYIESLSGMFAFNDDASAPFRVSFRFQLWLADDGSSCWCEGAWAFGEKDPAFGAIATMFRSRTLEQGRALMYEQWELGMAGARRVEIE